MARVVVVHGINNTFAGPGLLVGAWVPALSDGVRLAGGAPLSSEDVGCAFYGDVFRRPGRMLGGEEPWFGPEDVEEGFERDLLLAWWAAAAQADSAVVPPSERTLSVGGGVQAALAALACSRFLAAVSERALIFWLKQVRAYFTDAELRAEIQRRFAAAVGADTRVVVAHSLGSVVAYEALCANPQWAPVSLVTLGSPLGIRNLIFDRLTPRPQRGTGGGSLRGVWPAAVGSWTNIADSADFVALVKRLRPVFGDRVVDVEIDNGVRAHDVTRYLTAAETGRAVTGGLGDG